MIRLDRFIAENTSYSRNEAKRLIGQRRVSINGDLARSANSKIDDSSDQIQVDDSLIEALGPLYLMMNKPEGFVSATQDAEHPTIIDLLYDAENFMGEPRRLQAIQNAKLQIVGRLDKDTTGLIFLTTDGDWNHAITSPNSGCDKTYRVQLSEELDQSAIDAFQEGVSLKNESSSCLPASLNIIDPLNAFVTLSEGRYHQVKRMFAAIGNHVEKLERISIGAVHLDCNLKRGAFRALNQGELLTLNAQQVDQVKQ